MSSKYTTTNALVKGHKMSSINFMKVAVTFVNLKGMTNHSKSPSLDLKAIFHTSELTKLQVNIAGIFAPLELVQKVINPWDWVPIIDNDFVWHPIVNIESPGPILLMYQYNQTPTGWWDFPNVPFLQQLLNFPLDLILLQNTTSIYWSIGNDALGVRSMECLTWQWRGTAAGEVKMSLYSSMTLSICYYCAEEPCLEFVATIFFLSWGWIIRKTNFLVCEMILLHFFAEIK